MLVMVLVFGMIVISCDNGNGGGGGGFESTVWAQLQGHWSKSDGDASLWFHGSNSVQINATGSNVESLSSNRMVIATYPDDTIFNFVIEGDTLTVSNWSGFHWPLANTAAMNGVYTRQQ